MKNLRIGIIGCGNMGSAIIKAIHNSGFRVHSYDMDKKKLSHVSKKYETQVAIHSAELTRNCNVIILAVKPQQIKEVLSDIKNELNPF